MDADDVLIALLIVALVFAVLLILLSTAMAGRKIADLEYQKEAGINGVRQIQSWINVRTHANRVFLGLTFVVITVLLLADAPMGIRTWTNRVLFAVLMVSYATSSVMDWRAERAQMRIFQSREAGVRARAIAAGVREAEARAEAVAPISVVPVAEGGDPVTIQSISPAAVGDIVEAIKPAVTEAAVETMTGQTPPPAG